MKNQVLTNLRNQKLRELQTKRKAQNKSLIRNIKRLTIIVFIFAIIFILLFYRSLEELKHDIGDANTILEPILFIVLFIIFLVFFVKKR